MLDTKELPTVLNTFHDSGVKDHMFSLINAANSSLVFAVKTRLTEQRSIRNKMMQGDVMSTLMCSNMEDHGIGKVTVSPRNVYMGQFPQDGNWL